MRDTNKPSSGRRAVLAGAGVAGVLGAAAAVMPGAKQGDAAQAAAATAPQRDAAPGYRLTEHVQSYYRTARV
ncbi:MAG TPA: formate dehydrogenase [Methylibium sp.]|uniref:formate dehydrogenase n=1 Tax=Methylibium sp. TaxID=2067992 RepID=UPI002DBBD296|nr:formate dehydrogenase [Methylibium sp.]HEU4459856.1 formate dehydrogenase [Methylibium sp.]